MPADDGWAIFDAGPGAFQRRIDRGMIGVTRPSVKVDFSYNPRKVMRDIKGMQAWLHNLDKPLSVPTAQEIVMRQELGEFDG